MGGLRGLPGEPGRLDGACGVSEDLVFRATWTSSLFLLSAPVSVQTRFPEPPHPLPRATHTSVSDALAGGRGRGRHFLGLSCPVLSSSPSAGVCPLSTHRAVRNEHSAPRGACAGLRGAALPPENQKANKLACDTLCRRPQPAWGCRPAARALPGTFWPGPWAAWGRVEPTFSVQPTESGLCPEGQPWRAPSESEFPRGLASLFRDQGPLAGTLSSWRGLWGTGRVSWGK